MAGTNSIECFGEPLLSQASLPLNLAQTPPNYFRDVDT